MQPRNQPINPPPVRPVRAPLFLAETTTGVGVTVAAEMKRQLGQSSCVATPRWLSHDLFAAELSASVWDPTRDAANIVLFSYLRHAS